MSQSMNGIFINHQNFIISETPTAIIGHLFDSSAINFSEVWLFFDV